MFWASPFLVTLIQLFKCTTSFPLRWEAHHRGCLLSQNWKANEDLCILPSLRLARAEELLCFKDAQIIMYSISASFRRRLPTDRFTLTVVSFWDQHPNYLHFHLATRWQFSHKEPKLAINWFSQQFSSSKLHT